MNVMKQQMFLSIYQGVLSLETICIDARKIIQPFNLYLYDRHTFIELIKCLYCIYIYIRVCMYVLVSAHASQTQCHPSSLVFFLSPFFFFFFSFIFLYAFKKNRRTTASWEEEESSIVRSACTHWSVRSSRPLYRQYSQKKEKFTCYSDCATPCVSQFFSTSSEKKKEEEESKCNANKAKTSHVSKYICTCIFFFSLIYQNQLF